MNSSEYKISLDIHEVNSQHILHCKQGDTNRRITATLIEESELYHITEDCTAVFTALKPDGKVIFNEARIDGDTIIYDFTPQTSNVSGKLECELRLYGNDNALITSPSFTLAVHYTVYNEDSIVESMNEVNVLTGLISEASELIESVNRKLANGDFVPKFTIGTVATLPAGSAATATITGTPTEPVLNLGLPQGDEGQAESLIPDIELSLDSTKPVQNRVIAQAIYSLIKIGTQEPAKGPCLWLNTAYVPAEKNIAMLSLDEDESGAAVIASIEGEDYAINNSTLNGTPTANNYDFTIT